ncbi:TonB-dependent receptor domain-containing protein [Vibrio coralliilyticus]|uniref:TonB-dependent receptor domain-containing protein n=1 Tax=Vibrio coralliilyticus TaxID=190893 RepID=UPI00155F6C0F|nr:TonB-dependent receptor [Vibrio coralliilyticus]NRF12847.1 TonB-dependent receptor [Vibrio coralliilyticus]
MHTVFKLSPIALALASGLVFANQETAEIVEVIGNPLQGIDTIITAEDLSKQQAQDLNDVFRKDAEVTVGGSAGITQKIYVRGLEDTMMNISIDGAEQSGNLFHHQGRLSVEPELLKQVDVSAGAGRATNGPGALGGAIQFKTKDAHDLLQHEDQFGAQAKAGYYTNNNGYKVSTSLYGEVTERLGLLASFGYVEGDNIEDGRGTEQEYTAIEQQVALLKLSGQLNEQHYLSLSYDYRNDDDTRLNRPHFQPSVKNVPLEQEADRHTFTANHNFRYSDLLNLDTTLYSTANRIAQKDHPQWNTSDGTINTIGGKVFNTARLAQHTLITGADYKRDKSEFETNYSGQQNHEEKGTVYGLFVQDDWNINDAILLSAGARYDWYELTDNINQEFDSSGFSPNISLTYQLLDGLELFAGYAEAFRGQQIKELFVIDYRNNAADRAPERAKNKEIGASYRKNNLIAGFTFFDSKIEDVVTTSNNVYTNVGELTTTGFSAYVGYTLEQVSARLSYNQSNPELNGVPLSDGDSTLGTSIGDTWVLDVNYAANDELEFGWNARFVERLTDVADSSAYPEKPGYGVHDVYAQWLPLAEQDLTLTLSVKNVFDKYYFDHGSYMAYIGSSVAQGYASAGRDIRMNVSYAF